ncbi:MAG: aminotransferase class I/II-fold pyridoxal phosphate-dependent enzyme [Ignavibacteriaceae bacterium]
MKIETISVHAGRKADPATGAVIPPIYLSTTFEREKDGNYPKGYNYSRSNNPNRESLEECLAELESGKLAAVFSSGSAASMSILQSLKPGDHIIAPEDIYHGTKHLIRIFEKWNISSAFVDMTNINNVENAFRNNTKLIWIETPSNPLLKIIDIKKIVDIAKKKNVTTVCDNTWASPILQQPLEIGADLVLHATTKYIGGHSDILGGAVISREENNTFTFVREIQKSGGAVPSPFECWLVLRGIQTLPLRIREQSKSAMIIAQFLETRNEVEVVHYPGLEEHPGHELARKQMKLFGGMLSFQVKGDKNDALRLASKVKLFTRATSLGGPESLIEHRASVEGPETKTPQNLLRLSIGLEHPDDLIEDLTQAIKNL